MPTQATNPYEGILVKPTDIAQSAGTSAIPATVPATTSSSIIAGGQSRSAAHNALVLSASGRQVVGGGKRGKSRRGKSGRGKSRRGKSRRGKSRRGKSRRGGQTSSPSIAPKPAVPVPQFAGYHNAGANANSVATNHVAMQAGAQAALDNTNAPSSNTKLP